MKKTRGELAAAVLRLPASINSDISAASDALYRDLHPGPPAGEILRDLQYGPHSRNRLDLHLPSSAHAAQSLVLFVHGGGYVRGDKTQPGLFYYDNVGSWAARHGMVGAVMTYRLAPEHAWPSAAQDIAAAVSWLCAQAEEHGIDPSRIFLMGHSAGAAHAAGYLAGHGGPAAPQLGLAGCILLSGTYDLVARTPNTAYFGDDVTQYAARSSIGGLARSGVALLLGVAEADPPPIQQQFVLAQQAVLGEGRPLPHVVHAGGHNHYTIVNHLGTADITDTVMSDRILDFISAQHANALEA